MILLELWACWRGLKFSSLHKHFSQAGHKVGRSHDQKKDKKSCPALGGPLGALVSEPCLGFSPSLDFLVSVSGFRLVSLLEFPLLAPGLPNA